MRGLAYRRHQVDRIRRKRLSYYGGWPREDDRIAGLLVHTATLCSCPFCGNPRKWFGQATRQERQAAD